MPEGVGGCERVWGSVNRGECNMCVLGADRQLTRRGTARGLQVWTGVNVWGSVTRGEWKCRGGGRPAHGAIGSTATRCLQVWKV